MYEYTEAFSKHFRKLSTVRAIYLSVLTKPTQESLMWGIIHDQKCICNIIFISLKQWARQRWT